MGLPAAPVGIPPKWDRAWLLEIWQDVYGLFFLQFGVPLTRKILINGRREEEVRVAIVENQTLEDFEIQSKHSGLLRNNIYRAVVTSIAPSLNAAFVDFGESKNGFLAFNDVVESVYAKPVKDASKIADILNVGQELIVQIIKDATGLKGAQVTTNISVAGRYLVLRPKDAKSGVSRKVDDDARADLTQKIRSLDLPDGYGCIVRTNAMDQSRAILLRDAKVLVQLWHKIEAEAAKSTGPKLLYNDQDLVVQAMRDYFDSTINEVIIDDKSCYERALTYVKATVASSENKLTLYSDKLPLYTRYGIEKQIDRIYARTVRLPSGGFIVIDPTEALTAIDVNSAHSTKRESQDLTAYHTNLEAAVEIGRQLRMRDIGGLIVIDFIDMRLGKHQRDVERVMRNALMRDKARCKVERISANGLLEINRQRISQALSQRTHLECPTCGGRGFIPSADAIGMTLIREIDARAANGEVGGVIIKLHPDIAQQLQNERRREFAQLELEYGIRIEIVASRDISLGDESIEWLTKKQESELHPERSCNTDQDAASIIDVAEAYQTNDEGENAYRPNDFEEFSSEEARRKRAAKRAAQQESRNKPESESQNAPVHTAQTNDDSSEDSSADTKKVTGAHNASALAVLAILIDQMRGRMAEKKARHEECIHHHLSFRGRRRHTPKETPGIQSDLRLFVLDVLKAVCLVGCGCSTDVSRKEMLDRMLEASDWLMATAQLPQQELNKWAIALRNQVTSKHATARLNCLFDESSNPRPDEIAKILIDERNAALGNAKKLNEKSIQTLQNRIAARCASIFGDHAENTAPSDKSVQQPTFEQQIEDLNMNDIKDLFFDAPAQSENDTHAEPADALSDSMYSDDSENKAEHRRSRTRKLRQPIDQSRKVSPFAGENAEVVTSDVPIAPMTMLSDSDDAEAKRAAENKASLEQAITQELPAVSISRRVRHTRRDRENRQPDPQPMEPIPAETAPRTPASEPQIADAPAVSDSNSRRVRRTHRTHPMGQNDMPQTNVIPEATFIPERADSSDSAQNAEESNNQPIPQKTAADVSLEQIQDNPDITARKSRRTRRTRKADESERLDSAPVESAAAPVAVTDNQVISSATAEEAAVEVPRHNRRERAARKTKSTQQSAAEINPVIAEDDHKIEKSPRIDAVELLRSASSEGTRSTRKVRKTRMINADAVDNQDMPAAAQAPIPQNHSQIAPQSNESIENAAAPESEQTVSTNKRRTRRTRRTAGTLDSAPEHAQAEEIPAAQEPEIRAQTQEIPQTQDNMDSPRPRIRRTRRTRPEEE